VEKNTRAAAVTATLSLLLCLDIDNSAVVAVDVVIHCCIVVIVVIIIVNQRRHCRGPNDVVVAAVGDETRRRISQPRVVFINPLILHTRHRSAVVLALVAEDRRNNQVATNER
jgi:hypothetical protein